MESALAEKANEDATAMERLAAANQVTDKSMRCCSQLER